MPNDHRMNTIMSSSPTNGKASLTFESIVCSQLELKRHAASFSRRRSTMCRRSSVYIPPPPPSTVTTAPTTSQSNTRASTSTIAELSIQLLETNNSRNNSKRSRTSSINSMNGVALRHSIGERQSLVSMSYWDASRNTTSRKDESRTSKWSIDFPKDTPHYEVVTIFLGILLILPIIMISIGVSHLSDCPSQTNLPIYLFVAGIVWTTKLLQNIWHKYRLQQKTSNDEEPPSQRNDGHVFIDGLMTSFLIIWFFLGHYWLATIGYPPQFEQPLETPDIWCDKSVVLCTAASIFITYFIVITFIIIVLFLVCFTRYTIIKRTSTN